MRSRHSLNAVVSLVIMVGFSSSTCSAMAQSRQASQSRRGHGLVDSARRRLEMAELRLERYVRHDYPLEKRRLESAIRMTQAELEMFTRQINEYRQFTKFKHSAPLRQSLDYAKLNRMKAKTALDDLVEEKRLLQYDHRRQARLLELEVEAAAEQLDRLSEPRADQPMSSSSPRGRAARRRAPSSWWTAAR